MTHITSVSGGSIIAAHLVLNWDRYNGSPSEFDAAASEFLSFVRLDVRNRIARRFPLCLPLRWPRRLLGLSNRKLTRTGLLEYHYEKYLYGDTSLFELPGTAGTAHPRHQPERGMPVLLQPERPADDAPASRARRSHRPHPRRAGHGADGRHRLVGLPRVLPAARAHRRGRRRQRRRVRPAGVHRRRRLRQPRRPHVPLPGTAAPGGESPVRDDFVDFPGGRRGAVRGRQVRRGNAAAPARADPGGGVQPTGPVVTHRRGAVGRGRPPAARRAGAGRKPDSIAVVQARGRQRRRSGSRAVRPLGRPAPLPVPPRAALRRPEARGPGRGQRSSMPAVLEAASWRPAIRSG